MLLIPLDQGRRHPHTSKQYLRATTHTRRRDDTQSGILRYLKLMDWQILNDEIVIKH